MSLNQGIQKYRETARKTQSTKDKSKAAPKVPQKTAEKAPEVPEVKGAKASDPKAAAAKVSAARGAKASPGAEKASPDSEKKASPKAAAQSSVPTEIESAVESANAAEEAAREEAALQREIAEELERETVHTNALVKEDFTPVNSSRDKLIMEYAPLIKYIAQKIAARLPANIELDDLMSSGVIGLMDAIEKYDATRDNKFKTYAEFRIRGAILDELRAQDWVPRSVREKAKQLERCYSKIEQQHGRQATDEEVCEELAITQEEYHDMLNQVRSVSLLSYDDISSFSKADKRTLHGFGEAGSKSPTPFNEVNVAAIKRLISDAIQDLPERQRLVLSLYYYEDLNLKEIGRVLDVTESRVSQLRRRSCA